MMNACIHIHEYLQKEKNCYFYYLSDMVTLYSSLETVKNSMVARAKFIQGLPGVIVSKVLAFDVSQI